MNGNTHETAISIKYNKDFSVIQANELVRSKQDELTLLEAKIVRLAITQIVREDNQLNTYTCNVVDLARFLGISKDNIYRDIQDLSVNIMKKSIFIKEKEPKEMLMLVLPYADMQKLFSSRVNAVLEYKLENTEHKNVFLRTTDWLDLKIMFHINASVITDPAEWEFGDAEGF